MTPIRTLLLVVVTTIAATVVGWELGATLGSGTSSAEAATGSCDPSLSSLTTNHTSVPAGGSFAATLTVTCVGSDGPVAGRTIVLQPSGGNSTISPASAVTDANGVTTFSVSDTDVPPPGQGYTITYSAVDQGPPPVVFDQVVTIGFYYCECDNTPVPAAAIGGIVLSAGTAAVLVVWQVRRRRRNGREVLL